MKSSLTITEILGKLFITFTLFLFMSLFLTYVFISWLMDEVSSLKTRAVSKLKRLN